MKVIRGIAGVRKFKNPVVALGVFDGVHLAHQHILKSTANIARRIHGTAIVVTFWPHPQKQESLYSLKHRLFLISRLGIDACIVINFSSEFASLSAEDFIKKILVQKISARYICVGDNFRFGRYAQGTVGLLKKFSKIYNYRLKVFDVIKIKSVPVSSTLIRRLILRGELRKAGRLLKKPVTVLGTVIKGDMLARGFGFPTANINPHHEILPPNGIYAVRVNSEGKNYKGICYIGRRPTFLKKAQDTCRRVEVHIFNLKKDLYKKDLEIQFVSFIRKERRFDSKEDLIKQVKKDIFLVKTDFPSLRNTTTYDHYQAKIHYPL
ncbi:MAG: bifunctional riboflavin kinase/FAD synthetase [Candidatus Omnitrophica bacterium]|nr:bifunctional riboflavin kinase/FAD synthetase [Candidatus Omnitrophota bacterium]